MLEKLIIVLGWLVLVTGIAMVVVMGTANATTSDATFAFVAWMVVLVLPVLCGIGVLLAAWSVGKSAAHHAPALAKATQKFLKDPKHYSR